MAWRDSFWTYDDTSHESGDGVYLASPMPKRACTRHQALSRQPAFRCWKLLQKGTKQLPTPCVAYLRHGPDGGLRLDHAHSVSIGADVVVPHDLAPARHLGEQKFLRLLRARRDDIHP